ncbi:hypothetical protein H8R17_04835 [Streptomyces sp. TRM68367]|nr:hypothetical protein [Streptomyces sp. TRM68367]
MLAAPVSLGRIRDEVLDEGEQLECRTRVAVSMPSVLSRSRAPLAYAATE